MSTLKVDNIRHNSATSDAITMASDGTCTAKLTSIGGGGLSHRNLIINGAMNVSQRGTSSTVDGYGCIDRFRSNISGNDEAPTQSQVDVASGTSPYSLGFRKAFRMTNGNQTSGAGTTDVLCILHRMEAQDIANSGWNYTDSNSKITLSFWCKSSVAQVFYGYLRTKDGTEQLYPFQIGSLTANTWTKVTKTIPGNSNLQFDNNNDTGLDIEFLMYRGTDRTGSISLDAWGAYNSLVRVPDMTSTWYTTNDATFEITGVQLEVGDTATSFEHRSFAEELKRCQRYYYQVGGQTNDGAPDEPYGVLLPMAMCASATRVKGVLQHPVPMRTGPTVSGGGSGTATIQQGNNSPSTVLVYQDIWNASNSSRYTWVDMSPNSGSISNIGETGVVYATNSTYHFKVTAEL